MKTTEENNRMILDFMDVKPEFNSFTKKWWWNDGIFFVVSEDTEEKVMESVAKYAMYQSSYNWLMKVVEKIETLTYNKCEISFRISKYAVCLQTVDKDGEVINDCCLGKWATYGGTEKLRAIYDTCVEFIEFNNKNYVHSSIT